jgi:hypothetical protein
MITVTDIEIWRDGGTLEFRISNSDVDGFYRLQATDFGVPEPLFKNGVQVEVGSAEECMVLSALQKWLTSVSTPDAVRALMELEKLKLWLNLPERLSEVVPILYVRSIVQRLGARCSAGHG